MVPFLDCNKIYFITGIGKIWNPAREMKEIIDYELGNLNLLYPKPVIAVHVRGGDKWRELLPYMRNYK